MRRRLRVLVLAVTTLVATAFVVPLGILVVRQADLRARTAAERQAQDVAATLVGVLVAASGEPSLEEVSAALGPLPDGVGVILPGDGSIGAMTGGEAVVATATTEGRAVSAYVNGGWELAFPVVIRSGVAAVWVRVPDEELRSGVLPAIGLLVALGAVLVGVAQLLADRLGRSMTVPMTELAAAARRLGAGDLDTRVDVVGPPEVEAVSESFNWLAARLEVLLAAERESVADVSHRLRTPLTSLRLQAERIADPAERESILGQVSRLDAGINEVIADARRPSEAPATADLAAIVSGRARFWRVLADEQGRAMTVEVPSVRVPVLLAEKELGAMVDALIGNVFTHTPAGAGFSMMVEEDGPGLIVSDSGAGWDSDIDPFERGSSGRGSSGLGLDIVRRTAERLGGNAYAMDAPQGGASIVVRFGPSAAGDWVGG
ncbi:MAG: HAMP domain-containing histidine kinase [Acidimicrobiia bacterium]|nr:HAMP domain-containing histidine kinase [Acidimicrobiia bacterium]